MDASPSPAAVVVAVGGTPRGAGAPALAPAEVASPEEAPLPDRAGVGGGGAVGAAGGSGGAAFAAGWSPSSPMEDLVLEPPALPVAAGPPVGAAAAVGRGGSGVEEQYLDHVLEALVRARGIVLPRVWCVRGSSSPVIGG